MELHGSGEKTRPEGRAITRGTGMGGDRTDTDGTENEEAIRHLPHKSLSTVLGPRGGPATSGTSDANGISELLLSVPGTKELPSSWRTC